MLRYFNQFRFDVQQQNEQSGKHTFVHALNPLVKIWLTFILVIFVTSVGKYDLKRLILFSIYPFVLLALADISLARTMRYVLTALPFALFAGVSNLFLEKQTAFNLGQLNVTFGFISFIVILTKTWLTVSAVVLLFSTTTQKALIGGLSVVKVPDLLLVQLSMSLRYLSTLLDETKRMTAAYLLRSGSEKGIRISDAGGFLGHLLLRSYQRAERIYAAMKCRGFQTDTMVHSQQFSLFTGIDIAIFVMGTGALVLLRFVGLPY